MIGYDDLQVWVEQAKKIGELKVIEGVDPNLEAGTMVQINSKNEGPALLFTKVQGYSDRFRILTNSLANIRLVNLTFGLPIEKVIGKVA